MVDVEAPDGPLCDCGERAIMEFRADFESSGVITEGPGVGTVVTRPESRNAYACVVHAGVRGMGVLMAVAGAASSLASIVGGSERAGG